jgi:hypothetical protein
VHSVRPALLLALAGPLLLAGCGGGSTDTGAKSTPDKAADTKAVSKATDLCPLITAADLSTMLGYEVAFKRDPSNGCSYDSVKADARTEPSVGITNVLDVAGNGGFEGTRSGAVSTSKGTATDLPGVGDAAFVVTSGDAAPFTVCYAGAHTKGQTVSVILTGGGAANKAKLAPIAEKVLKLAVSKV